MADEKPGVPKGLPYIHAIDGDVARVVMPDDSVHEIPTALLPPGQKASRFHGEDDDAAFAREQAGHKLTMKPAIPGDFAPPKPNAEAADDRAFKIAQIQRGTTLAPDEEKAYQAWKGTLPPRLQYEGDYDLRGFYKKNPTFAVDKPGQHMTDEFKLPNHPTFSNESAYYNDDTKHLGGRWAQGRGGNWTFVPNDPAHKQMVHEDANGNRLPAPIAATGAPTALAIPGEAGERAIFADADGLARGSANAPPIARPPVAAAPTLVPPPPMREIQMGADGLVWPMPPTPSAPVATNYGPMRARAMAALADPNAPPEAKRAAAAIIQGGGR